MKIPHISLIEELEDSLEPISSVLEPLHSYLYHLSSAPKKEDRLKPTAFYFALEPIWSVDTALDVVIELYRYVSNTLLILSKIEAYRTDFQEFKNLDSLLITCLALKSKVLDISSSISAIKERREGISSKALCKKLFYFTESVRALVEELNPLKSIVLEDLVGQNRLLFTTEPLDLKGDLE